jgi:uncharacterized protein
VSTIRVRPLDPFDRLALQALLEREPEANLFLLATLRDQGLRPSLDSAWWGAFASQVLVSVCWLARGRPDPEPGRVEGLAVAAGEAAPCEEIGRRIAEESPPRMVIGARGPSDALWRGLGAPPTRAWYDQRLLVMREPSPGRRLPLRRALPSEWPLVSEMSARMMEEDLGEDPRRRDLEAHLRRVRERIGRGAILLGEEDEAVVFKLDLGSRGPTGVQVGGTWVPPEARGRGVATAGMRAAGDLLLPRHGWVSLHLNEANAPAMGAYLRAGFVRGAPFRLGIRAEPGNPGPAAA